MSVLSVNEVSPLRRLRDDAEEDSGARGFIVIMDAVSDGPAVARTADDGVTAIPVMGAVHPDNAGINVSAIDPQPTGNRMIWMVIVEYSGAPGISVSSPTNEPWVVYWDSENVEEIIAKTRTDTTSLGPWSESVKTQGVAKDDPIDNILGEVFDDPLAEDKAQMVCTLIKNKSSFDADEAEAYINSMNDAPIAIGGKTLPKWTAKLIEYSCKPAKRQTTEYYIVRYRVLTDRDTFIREVLNAGWHQLVGGEKQKVKNPGDGSVSDVVQKLDAAGAQTDTAYYWGFGTLLEKAFGTLNLPTTMP